MSDDTLDTLHGEALTEQSGRLWGGVPLLYHVELATLRQLDEALHKLTLPPVRAHATHVRVDLDGRPYTLILRSAQTPDGWAWQWTDVDTRW